VAGLGPCQHSDQRTLLKVTLRRGLKAMYVCLWQSPLRRKTGSRVISSSNSSIALSNRQSLANDDDRALSSSFAVCAWAVKRNRRREDIEPVALKVGGGQYVNIVCCVCCCRMARSFVLRWTGSSGLARPMRFFSCLIRLHALHILRSRYW
jgi:hypothetical protein